MPRDQVNLEPSTKKGTRLLQATRASREDQTQTLEKDQDLLPTQEPKKRSTHQELESHPCHTFRTTLREFQDYLSHLEVLMFQAQAFWILGTKFQSNSSQREDNKRLSKTSMDWPHQCTEDHWPPILMRIRKS